MDRLRDDHLERPRADRLPPHHPARAEIMAAHRRAVELGLSAYADPASGLVVMTAAYLADRGYCCRAGCRHCPYIS